MPSTFGAVATSEKPVKHHPEHLHMDSALQKRLDGIMLLLFFNLVAVAYLAADVVGFALAFSCGGVALVAAASSDTRTATTTD